MSDLTPLEHNVLLRYVNRHWRDTMRWNVAGDTQMGEARQALYRKGLVQRVGFGVYQITDAGREALKLKETDS